MRNATPADAAPGGPDRRKGVLSNAGLALAVFALAMSSILFTREIGRVAAIWPTNAAIFAAMLLAPAADWRRNLVAGLAGTLTANLVLGAIPLIAITLTACNGVEIAICYRVLGKRA